MATYWTTRSGEKIDIDKMSVSHLRNVLKMIVRAQQAQQSKQEQQDDWYQREIVDGIHSFVSNDDFYD